MPNFLSGLISNRITILIFSVLSPFLIINQYYFPFFGLAVFGIIYVSVILIAKSKISFTDWLFAAISILMALNFAFKTSWLVLFLSFCLYCYSTSWLVYKPSQNLFLRLVYILFPFAEATLNVWTTKDSLPKLVDLKQKSTTQISFFTTQLPKYLINLGITLVVLLIIIPLLSYSNPYFGSFFTELFNNIYRFLSDILSFATIFRILLAVYLYNFLPRLICFCQKLEQDIDEPQEFDLTFPKIAVALTLLVFLIAQVQTYFNPNLLQNTAGKMANEIFFHLSVVCIIVFFLILINLKNKTLTKIASYTLLLQTCFLSVIAFNSDWTYVFNWGLTHKRLYGFALVALVITFILTLLNGLIRQSHQLSHNIALAFCLIFGVTNLINFDYFIYRTPPRETTGVELDYVSAMSLDSYSLAKEYPKQLTKYQELQTQSSYDYSCSDINWFDRNYSQISYLQKKYKETQFLSFNYNEYANWLLIKDLKIMNKSEFKYYKSDYKADYFDNKTNNKGCYVRSKDII